MSYLWLVVNFGLVLVGAVIASSEDRFNRWQMGGHAIPWTAHGGSWADLIIVSLIMGLAMPYWRQWQQEAILTYGIISLVIGLICHIAWSVMQPIPGHIVDPRLSSYLKLPVSGWYHFAYMTFTLAVILLFYLATPHAPRLAVSILLTIFVVPAILQPGWYVSKVVTGTGRVDAAGWITTVVMWALIWGLGYTRP